MKQYKPRCTWCGNKKDSNDEWCSVRCYQEHKKNDPETFIQFEFITQQKHKEREKEEKEKKESEKESAAFFNFWGKIILVIVICGFGFCIVWEILVWMWGILVWIFRMPFG